MLRFAGLRVLSAVGRQGLPHAGVGQLDRPKWSTQVRGPTSDPGCIRQVGLTRAMRPGDVATVVRPIGTTKIVQDYTGDVADVERALNKAIDSCKINLRSPAFRELENLRRALKSADRPDEVSAAKREYVNAATDRVEQRLGQLRALVTSMSASEGKKVLVVITSGLSAKPGQDAYTLDEQIGLFERRKSAVRASTRRTR